MLGILPIIMANFIKKYQNQSDENNMAPFLQDFRVESFYF